MDFDTFIANNVTHHNVTAKETSPDPFYFYKIPQIILLGVLFILIVVGNSSVLFALIKHKGRKSRMNFFIMHLAIADLLVGFVSVLVDILWRITITWPAGNIGCKLIRYFQVLVTFSSTYVLVALSIDRYDAITRPMRFSGSWRRAKLLIGAAWGLSAIFSLPIPIIYKEKIVNYRAQCWVEFDYAWQWKVYLTAIACAVFVIPALIIVACYTVIVCTIWSKSGTMVTINPSSVPQQQQNHNHLDHHQHHHNRNNHHNQQENEEQQYHHHHQDQQQNQREFKSTKGTMYVLPLKLRKFPDDYESRRASSRGLIPRAKVKTIKMTFVIVFVFIICWSPYFIFDLLQVYGYIPETQTNIAIATFIQSLAPLNSAANPVIYCLFSTHSCSTVWKLPPFRWIVSWLSACFPIVTNRSSTRSHRSGTRYGETSTMVTETITQSSKRSRLTSGTSLRQIVMFRVNSSSNRLDAEVTIV